jgi:hypothetical protein
MFQPFFTTAKPTALAWDSPSADRIVGAHGGRLWVSPRASYGADVCFTVPLG